MNLKELKPRKALNKAFLKVKPNRTEIEGFKTHLITLLDRTNDTESEEFHKNLVSDFLKDTYYKQNHFINTKGRNDLVIHNGQNANSTVGVIIEAKKPTNKAEMISTKKLNAKAFQELVLYYLRERITHKNLEVKYLVATNINEWFIFDATLFERLFAQNKNLVKQFNDFEDGRLAGTKTDFFYKQIAEPFIDNITADIEFTYFNIQDFQKPLRNTDKADDNSLIALFKLLSPEHLLKLPFTNDSNSLDKRFYGELLHIIGLTETKEGSKKLIDRNKAGERHTGTIIEATINQLDSLDKLSRLEKPYQFGNTQEERLFNVALELSITWINRILFLKLLEAQLITYHKGDKSYSFLNLDKIKNYDDLNDLFFQVLARKYDERNEDVKKAFEKTPYLNSSLFSPTDIEQDTLFISNLKDDKTIPIFSQTVLKDQQGKKRTGNISTLQYFFEFLDAYDFGAEGREEIQEDNKTLINASVLGLIFEKINGYKDGSFFTPGFITMYMCRETIRKAVVQKFNETQKWHCTTLEEIYDKIEDRKEANKIVNSIKICDPAVGSGHFLVSALNEMIAVKNDLKILQDRDGKRLKEYQVEVVNDELIVTDEEGELFAYNPNNKESQRIQETLFHEKQTIIENCLFGVDINSNSVKICRLRLWIELLKNAYYKNATELETLPNIDINIKCGNSLVSRFAIDADLKQALKKSKWSIDSYRIAVDTYRNAENREQKREMERLISAIKSDFTSEIEKPFSKKISEARGKAEMLTTEIINLTSFGEKIDKNLIDRQKKAVDALSKLETERDDIKANKIFENAFEWRFEFPEVLNDDGDFVGFDVVIGNPPYITKLNQDEIAFYQQNYSTIQGKKYDLFRFFYERTIPLTKKEGIHTFIVPDVILNLPQASVLRQYILENYSVYKINTIGQNPFDGVQLEPVITFIKNEKISCNVEYFDLTLKNEIRLVNSENWKKNNFDFNLNQNDSTDNFIEKIKSNNQVFKNVTIWKKGLGVYSRQHLLLKFSKSEVEKIMNERPWTLDYKKDESFGMELEGKDVGRYEVKWNEKKWLSYGPWLAFQRPIEFFNGPRILVREITTGGRYKVFSAYVEERYYNNQSMFNGILKPNCDIELKYLLALLNSTLFSYWQVETSPKANRKLFPTLLMETVENFPIKKISKIEQQIFIDIVNLIITAKKNGENSEYLESKIDQLVYKLYDLTEEEIKIVEGN